MGMRYEKERNFKFIDQAGREVKIKGKIDKVISLWPEATRVLFALGANEKIVGLDSDSKKCPILERVFPKIKGIAEVGSTSKGTMSIERIVELRPDIIFIRTDDSEIANRIYEASGIPVVCVRIHPPPRNRVSFDIVNIIAKIIGEEKRGLETRHYLEHRLSDITSVTTKILEHERPSVYQAFAFDLLKTIGYFDVLDLAGGKNVARGSKEAWYTVSLEDLVHWNPQIIILHGFGKYRPEDVYKNPDWQQIRAVREKRVYRLTLGWVGWDPGGFVINVMANAKAFHPDKFGFDVEKEGNKIFFRLYGVNDLTRKYSIN